VPADSQSPLDMLVTAHAGSLAVPDHWQQGRGAFGGFVTGAMVRALEDAVPDRPLRSLTAELCGPLLPGDATLDVTLLRAGTGVTTASVAVVQAGEVVAHGVGVLGRERTRELDQVRVAGPALTPWRELSVTPIGPPTGPAFAQHFEFRVDGPGPFTPRVPGELAGWVRPKRPGARRDNALLAACVDAYWPTVFALGPLRPMATIAFTFQPLATLAGLDPDAPLGYRARLLAIDAGYGVEQRELWGEDGRLLALNQQTFVVIK
jgi:hypothetical protein